MYLSPKDLEYLEKVLSIPLHELYAMDPSNAVEKIAEARRAVRSGALNVPLWLVPKVEDALAELETAITELHRNLAEGGVLREVLWAYLKSAVDPSVNWVLAVVVSKDELLKYIPLLIPTHIRDVYGGAVIKPSNEELTALLKELNPYKPDFEHVLMTNEEFREVVARFIGSIARQYVKFEPGKVVFFDKELDVTADGIARIANAIGSRVALDARRSFYTALVNRLSRDLGNEVRLDLYSRSPDVKLVTSTKHVSPDSTVSIESHITLVLEVPGLYPTRIKGAWLTLVVNGMPCKGTKTLLFDEKVTCDSLDSCAEKLKSVLPEVIQKASEAARYVASRYREFESNGMKVNDVSLSLWTDRTLFSLTVQYTENDWTVTSEVVFDNNNNPVEFYMRAETQAELAEKLDKQWYSAVRDRLKNIVNVEYGDIGRHTIMLGGKVASALSPVEIVKTAFSTARDEYNRLFEEVTKGFKLTDTNAIVVYLLSTVDKRVADKFEEQVAMSFDTVVDRVRNILARKGRVVLDVKAGILASLIETGIVRVSETGAVYVENERLKDMDVAKQFIVDTGLAERELVKTALFHPETLKSLMLTNPNAVEKLISRDRELAHAVASTISYVCLVGRKDLLPRDMIARLVKSMAPDMVLELLGWFARDEELATVALYAAGRAGNSAELTMKVVKHYPQLLGEGIKTEVVDGTLFIVADGKYVLFAGLAEPSKSSSMVFEVYDPATKRGIVVKSRSVHEAVAIADEMEAALTEYRSILGNLGAYESKYGVLIDASCRRTGSFMLPELVIRHANKVTTIPLQPRIGEVFTAILESIKERTAKKQVVEEEQLVVA